MKANGRMTYSMAREWRLGQMVVNMKETMHMVESMG